MIIQPTRVEMIDLHKELVEGDYLRIHHAPRRFPIVNSYDWGKNIQSGTLEGELPGIPGVIVKDDPEGGFMVINKPPGVPVHPTVGTYNPIQ